LAPALPRPVVGGSIHLEPGGAVKPGRFQGDVIKSGKNVKKIRPKMKDFSVLHGFPQDGHFAA